MSKSIEPESLYAYVIALIVVIVVTAVIIDFVPIGKGIIIICASVCFVVLIGVFQLKNDDKLSEESFLKLILLILKKVPPFNFFIN